MKEMQQSCVLLCLQAVLVGRRVRLFFEKDDEVASEQNDVDPAHFARDIELEQGRSIAQQSAISTSSSARTSCSRFTSKTQANV